jgi:RNA polymerase sigma-70 factor (ECF subfamily)
VLLHAVFEASHAELAQASGRTEAASRQQLRRALLRLRQAREGGDARHGDGRDEPKGADPAVLRLYLQSLQSRDAQGLWALLRQPPVSALAIHGAVHAVLPLQHHARHPRATAGGVVQVGGQLGLVLTLDGVTLCVLPLGPCAELAHEGVVA